MRRIGIAEAGSCVAVCRADPRHYTALHGLCAGSRGCYIAPVMEEQDHVLVVDDDSELRALLAEYLGANGYRVSVATDGREMHRLLESDRPHLVVLDLILSARRDEVDRIVGIEMGADDYLGKPFSPRELLARIRGILRRTRALSRELVDAHRVRFAGWTLDLTARHLLAADGVVVSLSSAEFRLLSVFVEHPNRVLDRDQLMDLTLGREATPLDRSIDVQVSRLRQRLRDDARNPRIIKTVRNGGYVLAAAVERVP